jgi:hypothetical protein
MDSKLSLSNYSRAVDEIMVDTFGVDTGDFEIEFDELAHAHAGGITPNDFVRSHGEKYGLVTLPQLPAAWGQL